ncbi:MAG TPA: TIGR01777 family oxidoreductase [Sphingobacteriaceae bacterium]
MSQTILITGATGMLGNALTQALVSKGYTINQLSRKNTTSTDPDIKTFSWDVYAGDIDPHCIENVKAIIHLAGENIAARPWTKKRKFDLVESRTKSIYMIYDLLRKSKDHHVKTIVSASAVGFYGDRGNTLLTETSIAGTDFLSDVTVQWERAVDTGNLLNLRVVKLRSGIVLDKKEGALPQLIKPVKLGFPAALGSGNQWMPWIHLSDAVNMYIYALENENMEGAYNMASPQVVTNEMFMQTLAGIYHKKWRLPNVPAITLRILLGKLSEMLLMSTRTSSDKILATGFKFQFTDLKEALEDVLHK